MCTASILAKISVHSSDFVQKKWKNKLVDHQPFSKNLVGHRPKFQKWLLTDQFQKFWLATDQNFKNGLLTDQFQKFWLATDQNFKNGCSPTNFKNCGWPPNKIKILVGSQAKLKLGGLLTKRFGGFLANEFLHVIIQILIKNQAWKTTWQDGTIQPAAKLKAKSQTLNFAARNIFWTGSWQLQWKFQRFCLYENPVPKANAHKLILGNWWKLGSARTIFNMCSYFANRFQPKKPTRVNPTLCIA